MLHIKFYIGIALAVCCSSLSACPDAFMPDQPTSRRGMSNQTNKEIYEVIDPADLDLQMRSLGLLACPDLESIRDRLVIGSTLQEARLNFEKASREVEKHVLAGLDSRNAHDQSVHSAFRQQREKMKRLLSFFETDQDGLPYRITVLGAGLGREIDWIHKEISSDVEIVGIERNRRFVNFLTEKYRNDPFVEIVSADVLQYRPKSKANVALLMGSFIYEFNKEERLQLFANLSRNLKKNGKAFLDINVTNKEKLKTYFDAQVTPEGYLVVVDQKTNARIYLDVIGPETIIAEAALVGFSDRATVTKYPTVANQTRVVIELTKSRSPNKPR